MFQLQSSQQEGKAHHRPLPTQYERAERERAERERAQRERAQPEEQRMHAGVV